MKAFDRNEKDMEIYMFLWFHKSFYDRIKQVVKMKVIVMSDSHGKEGVLDMILDTYPNAEAYIHCGDIEEEAFVHPQLSTVRGNNDHYCNHPDSRILTLGKHKVFVVHSHQFGYAKRLEKMAEAAKEHGCDIVCYGHSHVAADDVVDGVRLLNPGSLWRSRDGRGPSYAIMEIDEQDQVHIKFIFLPQKASGFFW